MSTFLLFLPLITVTPAVNEPLRNDNETFVFIPGPRDVEYHFASQNLSVDAAVEYCKSLNATLIEVKSNNDLDWLSERVNHYWAGK